MSQPEIQIAWTPRRAPLAAIAAAARGQVAQRVLQRLLHRDDAQLCRLSGVAGRNLILLMGPQDELPWVDGVLYLGRGPGAPDLLLPTTLQPTVPESLLARAISHARIPPPIAILVDQGTLVSLAQAQPLSRRILHGWSSPSATG